MLAFFPSLLDANFPMFSPNHVNIKLTHENSNIARLLFSVIADSPKPVEKASMDTPNAKRNIPRNDRSSSSTSFVFRISNSKFPAMKRRIPPKKKL